MAYFCWDTVCVIMILYVMLILQKQIIHCCWLFADGKYEETIAHNAALLSLCTWNWPTNLIMSLQCHYKKLLKRFTHEFIFPKRNVTENIHMNSNQTNEWQWTVIYCDIYCRALKVEMSQNTVYLWEIFLLTTMQLIVNGTYYLSYMRWQQQTLSSTEHFTK